LELSGPGFFFRAVPLVSQDSGGRNYQIVIPFNTALKLIVHPSLYNVSDANGNALSKSVSATIPLLATIGQEVAPIMFTVSGISK
jgi:hypothetical protein